MEDLWLHSNLLEKLPSNLFDNLHYLQRLYIDDNKLTEFQVRRKSIFVRAMSQIANITKKVLKKEDYLNLYKDFDTLKDHNKEKILNLN